MELVIFIWVVCSVLDYGFAFAYDQRQFPGIAEVQKQEDRNWALCWCWLGPIGLTATFLTGRCKHGLKYL